MSEGWDRLITEMVRQMIREFLSHPAELVTFRRLAHRIACDADVLHAIAEQRPDLFVVTKNDRSVKLFAEAVERIVEDGIERTIQDVKVPVLERSPARDYRLCIHFDSEDEILNDLRRCSFHSSSLTRSCCWREICRVRSANPQIVDHETWHEVCRIRGYLQNRQNPRGF